MAVWNGDWLRVAGRAGAAYAPDDRWRANNRSLRAARRARGAPDRRELWRAAAVAMLGLMLTVSGAVALVALEPSAARCFVALDEPGGEP